MRGVVGVAQGRADHPAAVVGLLVVALDVPGGVVGDDEHGLGAVPDRGVDLHGVDAEGAVAVDRDHLALGKASAAATPNGTPTPRQPKAPASM